MEDSAGETPSARVADVRSVENAIRSLWERVRSAGDLIQQLREERQALLAQIEQLRAEVQHVQSELARREQSHDVGSQGGTGGKTKAFGNGEREALAEKVKDLLARIDAYL